MANERVIHIGTELDTSGMYAGINRIRQMLGSIDIDSNLFKDINKDLDKITKLSLNVGTALKNGIPQKDMKSFIRDTDEISKLYSALPAKIRQISIETGNIRFPKDVASRLDEIDVEVEKLNADIKKTLGSDLRDSIRNAIPTNIISNKTLDNLLKGKDVVGAFEDELVKAQAAATKTEGALRDLIKTFGNSGQTNRAAFAGLLEENLNNGTLPTNRDSLIGFTDDLEKDQTKAINAINNYNEARERSIALEQSYAQVTQIVSNAQAEAAQKTQQTNALHQEREDKINDTLQKNINAHKNTVAVIDEVSAKESAGMKEVGESASKANAHLQHQDSLLKQIASRATSLIGIGAVFNYITRGIRDAWNGIKDLDKEFTQIAVVTDKTTSQLWSSYGTYSQMAQGLGVATKDAVATSALYYQQGLDTADVMTLTAETIKMAQIAGMDFATATNQMTAAIRGFNLEMSQASMVNDIFSTLAANAAVSTQELSYALTKTASIAESAGMSIDTTSAFLTKMIETTREAPENIGTAMKSIIARFEELKKNPLALTVEVDGEEVVANKVEAAIALAGVKLRDANEQFRDLDDVFLELAKSWDGLDRNTQRYIATIAAGSRQQSRFIALMDGYDRTLELTEIAQDSEGQSAAQFLKTLDSLDSKLNRVGNSLEQLYQKFVNSDFFGGLLDGLNNLLQKIGEMDAGQLTTFLVAGIAIGNNIIKGIQQAIKNTDLNSFGLKDKITNTFTRGIVRKAALHDAGYKKDKNSINERLYAYNNINGNLNAKYNIDVSSSLRKLSEVRNAADKLKTQISQDTALGIDTSKAEKELEALQLKEQQINSEIVNTINQANNDGTFGPNKAQAELFMSLDEVETELNGKLDEVNKTTEAKLKQSGATIKQNVGQLFVNTGMALVSSLSIGISMALSSDDPTQAIVMAMSTFALQMLPQLFSMMAGAASNGMAGIRAAVDAAGGWITLLIEGITLAITGLVTWITWMAKNTKSESEKIQDTLKELSERKKTLEEESERSNAEYSVKKIENKNLEKLISNYDKLINKTNRTTEENDKLNSTISDLAKDFPDLVKYYDEAGNAVLKQRQEWEKIVEKQKESAKIALGKSASDELEIALNDREIAETELKRNKIEQKDWLNSGVIRGYNEEKMTTKGAIDYISNRSDINSQVEFLTGLYQGSDNMFKNIIANMAINLDKTSDDFNELLTELTKLDESQQLDKITEYFGLTEELKNQYIEGVGDNLVQFINELKNIGELNTTDNKYEKAVANEKEHVRELIANQTIEFIDNLGEESSQYSGRLKGYVSKGLNNKKAYQDLEKVTLNPQSGTALSEIKRIAEDNSSKISSTKLNSLNEVVEHHKDDENLNLNDEEKQALQAVVEELRTELYTQLAESATDGLKAIEEKLSEEDFELINSEDWGNIGLDKLTEIKNSISGFDKDTAGEIDKYIDEVSKKYTNVFGLIAQSFGENITQKLIDNNITEQFAQEILKIFNGMDTSKVSGILEFINNPQTDFGNFEQLKQLTKYFMDAGNSAEEAANNVMKFANAMDGTVSLKIDKDYFNGYFTELGKTVQDAAKEYKDLYSAMKEYKDMGHLSAQTIIDLVASGKAEYLTLDENTGALKLNTQAIEDNWHSEMEAATASLDMEIAKQEAAQAGLKIQLEVEKRKLEILRNAKNKNGAITAAEYNELRKLDEAYSVDIINNQIDLNTESLIQDGNFFTDLLESREKGYGQLVQQAVYYGKQIQEALISGATSGNTFTPTIDLSNAWAEQEKENRKASAKAKMMPDSNAPYYHYDSSELDALIAQEDDLIKALEGEIKNRDEVLNQLKATKDKIKDITVNSSFADYMKDTGKATKDANEELKKYVSTLERFYNLKKENEMAEREYEKATKAFEKDRSVENGQAVIDSAVKVGNAGMKMKNSGIHQEQKDRGYARDEIKEIFTQKGIKLTDEGFEKLFEKFNLQKGATGYVDQRAFEQWLIEQKKAGTVTYDNADEIEKVFNEWKSHIDDDNDMQLEGQDQYEKALEDIEDFEEKLKEIKEALDPLVAIKDGIAAANKLLENAKDDLEDYYTSGGKQGINIAQYGHTVGSAMGLNDTTLEKLENYKNSLTSDNSELMKYLVNLGEGQWTYDYSTIGQITDKKTIDAVSDLLEKLKEVGETEEDLKKKNKELGRSFQDALKKNRLEYSNLVNRVAQAMADLDQKEIDEVKKKYAMIQEEDDKYLEALQKSIDKQRQLRDQAKSYDDLEKDEKRLALLERDTSGANAAEIAALREQIKDKRENLVDTEQDNIVNKISEDNKNRKDKMDEETQFLQNVMDERTYDMQYYIEKAYDIVDAAINGDEGAYQRMLEILKKTDAEFYRTTKEGQQIWFESLQESWTHAKDHALAVQTELIENLGKTDSQVHENLTNFAKEDDKYVSDASKALEELGKKTDTVKFNKCWDELTDSCKKAKDKMDEIIKAIDDGPYETEAYLVWHEDASELSAEGKKLLGGDTTTIKKQDVVGTPDTATLEKFRSQWEGEHPEWYTDYKPLVHGNDEHTRSQFNSSTNLNNNNNNQTNTSQTEATKKTINLDDIRKQLSANGQRNNVISVDKEGQIRIYTPDQYADLSQKNSDDTIAFDKNELLNNTGDLIIEYVDGKLKAYWMTNSGMFSRPKSVTAYAKGGLVDFTGPAWVDGTKTDPEAFLTAEDTRNIQALTSILQNVISPTTAPTPSDKSEVKAGDTNIEIHIDVEKIENDYDVEQMLDTIESRISEASKGQVTIVN